MSLDPGFQIDSTTRPALQELLGCRDESPRMRKEECRGKGRVKTNIWG